MELEIHMEVAGHVIVLSMKPKQLETWNLNVCVFCVWIFD